jgi:hypothetical protein
MASRDSHGGLLQGVRTLFGTGTTGGLTDGELLGLFANRQTEEKASGPAFTALALAPPHDGGLADDNKEGRLERVSELAEEVRLHGLVNCSGSTGSAHARWSTVGELPIKDDSRISSGSPSAPILGIPGLLVEATVTAMLWFAAGRPFAGAVSSSSLSWTLHLLRTMQS